MVSPVILESFRHPCTLQQLAKLLIDLHLEMSRWFRWLPEICLYAAPHIEPVTNIGLCSRSLDFFLPLFFKFQSIFKQLFQDLGKKKNFQEKAWDLFLFDQDHIYLSFFWFFVVNLIVHGFCGQVFIFNFFQESGGFLKIGP